MVINTINNFLCHFFFVIADKSLERKAIREKMLLKILSSSSRIQRNFFLSTQAVSKESNFAKKYYEKFSLSQIHPWIHVYSKVTQRKAIRY